MPNAVVKNIFGQCLLCIRESKKIFLGYKTFQKPSFRLSDQSSSRIYKKYAVFNVCTTLLSEFNLLTLAIIDKDTFLLFHINACKSFYKFVI